MAAKKVAPQDITEEAKQLEAIPDDFRKLNFNDYADGQGTSTEWENIGLKFVEYLNAHTPNWILYSLSNAKKRNQGIKSKIYPDRLGEEIISENLIERYKKLPEGAMYNTNHGTWELFERNGLKSFVQKTTISKIQQYDADWDVYINRAVADYVYSQALRLDVYDMPFEEADPNLVAFKNGTYNFATGRLEDSKPENMLISYHDYDLDTIDKPTPYTDKLLSGMMGKDPVRLFEQYIGYMFYHSYTPIQSAIFLHGNGGEGKSTLLNYIAHDVIGKNNVATVNPKDLAGDNRFKAFQLFRKEANIVADIAKGYLQNTDILKTLTGGDGMDAEAKGMQGINFTNYAKLLFSANELPKFSDTSSGFQDRLIVIELINGDTRQSDNYFWDNQDMKAVKNERDSFVYKCLKEFKKALDKRSFDQPQSVVEASKAWHKANDHFGEFLEEECEINISIDKGARASDVVSAYKGFCQKNNYSEKTTAQTITANLERLGVKKSKNYRSWTNNSQQVWRYMGLKLNNP
ncbi:phage/plasmid primase, P4 family [Pediococcus argentinicus]|uniref:phage/plasmid primase, P4 family n=1 Tax=Pediococcus argentinicus TaxID=480391 RepID=UPI00338FA283